MIRWEDKDADETVAYGVTFADRVDTAETITTAVWTMPSGLTNVAQDETGQVASILVSGGVALTNYLVGVRIVTSALQTLDETIQLRVRAR